MNINTNTGIGLNLTKRVAPGADNAATVGRTGGASFSNDSLVRTGGTAAATGSAGAAATAAMDRLASAYDADPAVFARNLAEQALNDVVAHIG